MHLIKSQKKGDTVYFKIEGEGSMHNAHPLSLVLNYLKMDPNINAVFDFSECDYIDSTFIGILTSYAIYASSNNKTVVCNNVKDKIKEALDTMGVSRFLEFTKDLPLPADGYKELKNLPLSSLERTRYILSAHKTLTELSDENKKRFADVMRFLEEDLKNQERNQ